MIIVFFNVSVIIIFRYMRILRLGLILLLLSPGVILGQQKYTLGLKFNDFEYNKIPKRYFSVRGSRTMPQSYSLKQYCPKPLTQLNLKSSAGWAAGYAALSILKAQEDGRQGSAVMEKVYAPSYPYYMALKDAGLGVDDEIELSRVLKALEKYGTPTYRQLPSRQINAVSDEIRYQAQLNRISEYARLYDKHDTRLTKLTAIKATLNENLPVIVSMHTPKSFFYAKDFWQPREQFSDDLPGHALTVIGYDDTKNGGAFEVMNSWGTDWGNNGFMWIRYDDFIEFVEGAYDVYVIPGGSSGIELGGSIEMNLVEGNTPMEIEQLSPGYYKIAHSYPSGTTFTIQIKNESPAFIYVFASDLTGGIYPFFPPNYTSAALSKATSFYVPDANTPTIIDDTKGTDYLCVLFSKEDLDITGIYNTLGASSGDFKQKVTKAINGQLIPPESIRFKENTVGFKMVKSNKSVVMIIIEHDHQ